jgi:hypothetical protein
VKEEIVSDDEYEFEFSIDDTEYDEVLKELRAKDSDLEEVSAGEVLNLNCSYEGCNRSFARKYNLQRHMKSHEIKLIGSEGHICHSKAIENSLISSSFICSLIFFNSLWKKH